MTFKTEDVVRDEAAKILGFDSLTDSDEAESGVGQLTTFNRLGFIGFNKSPDGWYLPKNHNDVAILLETKNSSETISKQKYIDSLIENIDIFKSKYQKIIGILYNGHDVIVYQNEQQIEVVSELQNKEYYLSLFNEDSIDRNKIYSITKKINDTLHFKFKINNLYHRMIFTACALVAERYDGNLKKVKGLGYATFHTSILSTLSKSLQKDRHSNSKLDLLLEVYSEIRMSEDENQEIIDSFIDDVVNISNSINSDHWNGEDVMAIFFNEFNRYKDKSEHGQIFTPEHITSLMYRIIGIDKNDYVLDAACGSGAFLVKAMSKMIQEAGGVNTTKAGIIKGKQLYGIEFDRQIYALACANMLIHKDGKTNLALMDAQTPSAANWMSSKPITKVLMNPPYENKYGCIEIVENVLNSVQKDTVCAFILPDRKLETVKKSKKMLKKHRLMKVIKLPLKLFDDGGGTSIFIFNAKTPQDNKEIFGCYMKEDGLERVKNQGRHDVGNKWQDIEDYWVDVI